LTDYQSTNLKQNHGFEKKKNIKNNNEKAVERSCNSSRVTSTRRQINSLHERDPVEDTVVNGTELSRVHRDGWRLWGRIDGPGAVLQTA